MASRTTPLAVVAHLLAKSFQNMPQVLRRLIRDTVTSSMSSSITTTKEKVCSSIAVESHTLLPCWDDCRHTSCGRCQCYRAAFVNEPEKLGRHLMVDGEPAAGLAKESASPVVLLYAVSPSRWFRIGIMS
eukprot:scpid81754/ scgid15932/ 